jgi:endogenous inhibitor of DNA gyrase (YacG/DUF329 family)
MWKAAYGPIPDGFDVHHKDDDPGHNELDNFKLLSRSDHTALHYAANPIPKVDWQAKPDFIAQCVDCGAPVTRKQRRLVSPAVCRKCQYKRGDANRTTERHCENCGAPFMSIRGNFCSQRCVNLGARWRSSRI